MERHTKFFTLPARRSPAPHFIRTTLAGEDVRDSTMMSTLLSSTGAIMPLRRADAPYIRPSKFVPVLDYFWTSPSSKHTVTESGIQPTWRPPDGERQLSSWRKVSYDVPPPTRRDSLSSLVEKSMRDIGKEFKSNISQISQGLCYNRMERKIESDLATSPSNTSSSPPKGKSSLSRCSHDRMVYRITKSKRGSELGSGTRTMNT